ncbi:unnamed protein product [Haemonchus placei]|uniref:Uncharacterized protein n=1 Tax=Haemonchus placei TaxID=6290 RepID=A0A0N4W1Y3_HAEPC|nr:unnamed protein product [Haemonchus placei]
MLLVVPFRSSFVDVPIFHDAPDRYLPTYVMGVDSLFALFHDSPTMTVPSSPDVEVENVCVVESTAFIDHWVIAI